MIIIAIPVLVLWLAGAFLALSFARAAGRETPAPVRASSRRHDAA